MKTLSCILFSFLFIGSTSLATGIHTVKNNSPVIKTSPPVQEMLSYFRAHRQGKGVTLNWGMSFNTTIAYFIIERSYDGEFFDPVNQIPGDGSARLSWHDGSVFPGYIHYRVVCVMMDGTEFYSEIKTVRIVQHG